MKLTKDMFDFEKYEYFDHLGPGDGHEWLYNQGNWVPVEGTINALCRKPKPPPRYILLNEGEKLQAGDQKAYRGEDGSLTWDGSLAACRMEVHKGEIWRRKVQE